MTLVAGLGLRFLDGFDVDLTDGLRPWVASLPMATTHKRAFFFTYKNGLEEKAERKNETEKVKGKKTFVFWTWTLVRCISKHAKRK